VKNFNITIITGMSGSGKSTAAEAYEDMGYYCVDNMPVELVPKFLEMPLDHNTETPGFALVMDLREKGLISKYQGVFHHLRNHGYAFEILFLEADENVLVMRYSQTRRHHPLAKQKNLTQAIRAEKTLLEPLRNEADLIIDTSGMTVHHLRARILDHGRKNFQRTAFQVNILSFGFKKGIPINADLMMDVRFLVNPYFEPDLKELNGESKPVRDYVINHMETQKFLIKYLDMLDYLLPLYEKEGKAYLTLGIGCTGGRHRSVAIAREVFVHLEKKGIQVTITHRDI
jgi:RNase adapter protein RapZ